MFVPFVARNAMPFFPLLNLCGTKGSPSKMIHPFLLRVPPQRVKSNDGHPESLQHLNHPLTLLGNSKSRMDGSLVPSIDRLWINGSVRGMSESIAG